MKPFQIDIPQATLDELKQRLEATRWPGEIGARGWQYGTDPAYLKELVQYWQQSFDWRAQEKALNQFSHYKTDIDGYGLHFIYEKGKGENPMPLLLNHGWPDSFYRFVKLIPLLTDPVAHGGQADDAFDVIVPSLPGYGFSDTTKRKGSYNQWTGELLHKLMTETLGYGRYGAHGGDVGSGITEGLGMYRADALTGIHLVDVPYWRLFATNPDELSEPEKKYLAEGQQWSMKEGAYAMMQATKPQTLAYGLNDSPAGLAAWMIEKFYAWSDCRGNLENTYTKDELLTNITLYWVTETIRSSFMPYWDEEEPEEGWGEPPKVDIPTSITIFPKDIVPAPKEFAERFYNLQRWAEMEKGGHFAALEEPELLASELRAFFRPLRS